MRLGRSEILRGHYWIYVPWRPSKCQNSFSYCQLSHNFQYLTCTCLEFVCGGMALAALVYIFYTIFSFTEKCLLAVLSDIFLAGTVTT